MMLNPTLAAFNPSPLLQMSAMQQMLSRQNTASLFPSNMTAEPFVAAAQDQPESPETEEPDLELPNGCDDLLQKILNKPAKRKRGRKAKSEKDSKSAVSDTGSLPNEEMTTSVVTPPAASVSPLSALNDELTRRSNDNPNVVARDEASPLSDNFGSQHQTLASLSKELEGVPADSLPKSASDFFLPTNEDWSSELNPYAPEWHHPAARSYVPPPPPKEEFPPLKTSWKTVPGAPDYKTPESQAPYVKKDEPPKPKVPFQTQRVLSTVRPEFYDVLHKSDDFNSGGKYTRRQE